jgi:hypothetical protein
MYDFPLVTAALAAPAPVLTFLRILAGLASDECNVDPWKQTDRVAPIIFELVKKITLNIARSGF